MAAHVNKQKEDAPGGAARQPFFSPLFCQPLFYHKETANAAISPGSKNHVTRKHPALQPKRLQIMDMMMMMALPELNIDLLMMTMLVIWITMHMNSQGFDEPPAPYLTPPLPNNSLPHAHFAQGPHKPNTPLLHPLRQYTCSIPRLRLLAKVRRFRAFAILPSNGSFGSYVSLKTTRRLQAPVPFSPQNSTAQNTTSLLPTHPRPGGMREAIK